MLRRAGVLLSIALLALAWGVYRVQRLTSWDLPQHLIKQPVCIRARIISDPKVDALAAHFTVKLTELAGEPVSAKAYLSWYGRHPILKRGDEWEWTVKLKPAHRLHNFGPFSEGIAFLMSGVRASGYVDVKKPSRLIQRDLAYHPMLSARASIKRSIDKAVSDSSLKAIITALSVGSRDLLSADQWQVFRQTGTSHLVAISGLHVGFVTGLIYCVVSFLSRLFPRLMLRVPASQLAAGAALVGAVFYGFLAGFSLPTQRAVVMVVMLMLGHLFCRNVALWQRFLGAFVVVFMFEPLVLFSPSFYLSFLAVLLIAYVLGGRLSAFSKWQQWSRMQWAIFIGLAPVTLYFFQQVSWVGFAANAVAIPWVGFLIVPLCFCASLLTLIVPAWGGGLFHLAAFLLAPLWSGLQHLAGVPHITWQHVLPHVSLLWASVLASLWLLAPRGWPGRFLAGAALLFLVFYPPVLPQRGSVWLTALDVGQGLSVVVRTTHHTLLYDTGPHFFRGFNAGTAVILPYLRRRGIGSLDLLMVSHGDNDHSGGARAILAALPVTQFLTSIPRQFKPYSAEVCYAGQHWDWDGVSFQVLWPPKGKPYLTNNSSCVLRIKHGKESILLTGDIERPVEEQLVRQGVDLQADILVAPHHGSRTSSSEAFVQVVAPKAVIFSDGYYNRYNHPSPEVVRRYRSKNVQIFDTAQQGAISLHLFPDGSMTSRTVWDEQGGWRW